MNTIIKQIHQSTHNEHIPNDSVCESIRPSNYQFFYKQRLFIEGEFLMINTYMNKDPPYLIANPHN